MHPIACINTTSATTHIGIRAGFIECSIRLNNKTVIILLLSLKNQGY